MTSIENWIRRFRHRLSSNSICFFQSREGVESLKLGHLSNLWIVGRANCLFRTMDLTNVPRSKIEQAVSLQVPAVSPFSETGYWYFEDFGRVSIWLWDEALRRSLSTRDTERDVEVLPESCFTLEENEGSYVYRCKEGYMFQCWRDGELISDSWWEESLNKGQLEVLKRGLGGTIDDPQERDMD